MPLQLAQEKCLKLPNYNKGRAQGQQNARQDQGKKQPSQYCLNDLTTFRAGKQKDYLFEWCKITSDGGRNTHF